MNNIIEIDGHKAMVLLDSETSMMRGEFVELNGGADFYADNIGDLCKEGSVSLKVFVKMCREQNISPFRS